MERKDFELGDEITNVERATGRSRGMVLSVRLGPDDAQRLYAASATTGRKMSDIVRAALQAYLNPTGSTSDEVVMNLTLAVTRPEPVLLTVAHGDGGSQMTYAPLAV